MPLGWARWGVLICVLALGCAGGGDGAAAGPSSVYEGSTSLAAGFTPTTTDPGPQSVALALGGTNANLVTLQVRVADVADVFGADFELHFDPNMMEFVSWSPGVLLETDGAQVVYQVTPLTDYLQIGMSRIDPPQGVDVTGSRTLIHLTFRARAPGTSLARTVNGGLLDSQPPAPGPIPGISWLGGYFHTN
jgi:hypothetical protein